MAEIAITKQEKNQILKDFSGLYFPKFITPKVIIDSNVGIGITETTSQDYLGYAIISQVHKNISDICVESLRAQIEDSNRVDCLGYLSKSLLCDTVNSVGTGAIILVNGTLAYCNKDILSDFSVVTSGSISINEGIYANATIALVFNPSNLILECRPLHILDQSNGCKYIIKIKTNVRIVDISKCYLLHNLQI